jgi:hypothetical protein
MSVKSGRKRTQSTELQHNNYDESNLKGLLSDEYKILQDKIDKIGAFRFTIKGWSITAVIAASAAASGKGLSAVFTISLGLVVMLIFFFLLECEQVKLTNLFGDRAGRLEDAFRRINRGKGQEVYASFPVPHTAHELALAKHREKPPSRSSQSAHSKKASSSQTYRWQAHPGFYLSLSLLALVPLAPLHHAIGDYCMHLRQILIPAHVRAEVGGATHSGTSGTR